MGTIERFEDLDVWQRSRQLVNETYGMTGKQAFSRDFISRDQMRRSSISIMSNIAEGFESRAQKKFVEYLGRAKASAGEFRAQSYLARDRDYLSETEFNRMLNSVITISKTNAALIRYLKSKPYADRIKEEVANNYV